MPRGRGPEKSYRIPSTGEELVVGAGAVELISSRFKSANPLFLSQPLVGSVTRKSHAGCFYLTSHSAVLKCFTCSLRGASYKSVAHADSAGLTREADHSHVQEGTPHHGNRIAGYSMKVLAWGIHKGARFSTVATCSQV